MAALIEVWINNDKISPTSERIIKESQDPKRKDAPLKTQQKLLDTKKKKKRIRRRTSVRRYINVRISYELITFVFAISLFVMCVKINRELQTVKRALPQ